RRVSGETVATGVRSCCPAALAAQQLEPRASARGNVTREGSVPSGTTHLCRPAGAESFQKPIPTGFARGSGLSRRYAALSNGPSRPWLELSRRCAAILDRGNSLTASVAPTVPGLR